MNLDDSKRLFKQQQVVDPLTNEIEYEITLKSDASELGYIKEVTTPLDEITYQFIGRSNLGNKSDAFGIFMEYPVRYNQFEELPFEYLALELESGYNQALYDALHYYKQITEFIFPDYSPFNLKLGQ